MDTKYTEVVLYHRDDVVFREGEEGGCMYVVESGRIGIISHFGTPEVRLLAELGPGEIFGEMGMVRGNPRSATAVVLEPDTGLRTITWDTLGDYFQHRPSQIVVLMQQMSNRIANTTEMYLDACRAVTELSEERDRLAEENAVLRASLAEEDKPLRELSKSERQTVEQEREKSRSKYQNYIKSYTGRSYSRFARK